MRIVSVPRPGCLPACRCAASPRHGFPRRRGHAWIHQRPQEAVIFDLCAIDKTADPCTDFYQYACGNWMKNNPDPGRPDALGPLQRAGRAQQLPALPGSEVGRDAPKTPLQKKYGDYFAACMNTDLVDKLGAKPLEPELDAIAGVQRQEETRRAQLRSEEASSAAALLFGCRRQPGPEGLHQADRGDRPGRPRRFPTATTTSTRTPRSQKLREQYVDAHEEDVRAARRHRRPGRDGSRRRHEDRDGAGARAPWPASRCAIPPSATTS